MSDETEHSSTTGWVKLFHSSGALVTLPLPIWRGSSDAYKVAFAAVSEAIAAGFTVTAPGLEAGEQKEEIGYVLRRSKTNEDRTETPIIDLYLTKEAVKFKILSVYLNDDAAILAFEKTSGMRLESLKEYPGTSAPERGASKTSDSFIIKCPRPFGVVMEQNPKYNAEEAAAVAQRGKGEIYGVPKRRFVRWESQTTTPPASQGQAANSVQAEGKPDPKAINEWAKRLAPGPSCDALNASLKDTNAYVNDKPTWKAVHKMIADYAAQEGMDWSQTERKYLPPITTPDTTEDNPTFF